MKIWKKIANMLQILLMFLLLFNFESSANAAVAPKQWLNLAPKVIPAGIDILTASPGIAIDSKDVPYVYYSCFKNGFYSHIRRYNYKTNTWDIIGSEANGLAPRITRLSLAIDKNDTLYAATYSNLVNVYRYNNQTLQWDNLFFPYNNSNYEVVAKFSPSGELYVLYKGGLEQPSAILKYNSSNNSWVPISEINMGVGYFYYLDFAFDSNNNLYVTYTDGNDKLYLKKHIMANNWQDIPLDPSIKAVGLSLEAGNNSTLYISYCDRTSYSIIKVLKYEDNIVSQIYNNIQYSNSIDLCISNSGEPYIAFDKNMPYQHNGVQKYDSSSKTWIDVLNTFDPNAKDATDNSFLKAGIVINKDDIPYVMHLDYTVENKNNISAYKYCSPTISIYYSNTLTDSGSAPVDENTYFILSSGIVKNQGTMVRNGYSFGGWTLDPNGTGTIYQLGDKIDLLSENITLYPKWLKTVYTVNTSATNGTATTDKPNYNYTDIVTITAIPDPNYTFTGWYDASGNLVSKNSIYKFFVFDNISYNARFELVSDVSMTVNLEGTGNVTNWTNGQTKSYKPGSTLSLQAVDTTNNPFMFWKNANGKVLTTNKTYTLTIGTSDTLTAVFGEKANEKHMVTFKNGYGEVIKSEYVQNGTPVTFPTPPTMYGYSFSKWDKLESDVNSSTTDIIVTAVYEKLSEEVTITVNSGTGSGNYIIRTIVTITAAPADEGKKFSHWENSQNTIVDYNESYKFYATTNETFTAIYVNNTVTVDPVATVIISSITETTDKLIFAVERNVPSIYTLISHGIIITSNNEIGGSEVNFIIGANDIIKGTGKSTNPTGTYAANKVATKDQTWYARGYIVYMDANGNIFTIYSAISSKTKSY